jgi:hypothetical protein
VVAHIFKHLATQLPRLVEVVEPLDAGALVTDRAPGNKLLSSTTTLADSQTV